MDDKEDNYDKANQAFKLPIFSVGLILGYFFSQLFISDVFAYLNNVSRMQLSTSMTFYCAALNAGIWIAICTSVIPKLNLPKMKKSNQNDISKYILIGVGLLILFRIFFGYIALLTNFKPEMQGVAKEVQNLGTSGLFIIILSTSFLIPIIEELLFRDLLHRSLKVSLSATFASIISATLFGFVHILPDVIPSLIDIGLVLSYTYEKSGSIIVPIALHIINNFVSVIGLVFYADLKEQVQDAASILIILCTSF